MSGPTMRLLEDAAAKVGRRNAVMRGLVVALEWRGDADAAERALMQEALRLSEIGIYQDDEEESR